MLLQLLIALVIVALVHLLAMAACAHAAGLTVREITFGIGPRLVKMGVFRLALLPVGGQVRLANLSDYPVDAPHPGAFELQPAWKRVLLPLSGPLALLILGAIALGPAALDVFKNGFAELLGGAIDPFNQAQVLLRAAADRLSESSLMTMIGLAACKFAAFNLMPYMGSNSLQAFLGLFPSRITENKTVSRLLWLVALPLWLLLMGGWLLALLAFV